MKKNQNNINIKLSKIDEILTRSSIIPVMVIEDYRVALNASEALLKGGISVIEITLRTPTAFKVAEKVLNEFPEIKVGIGTIINPSQLIETYAIGAHFGVSPGYNRDLIELAEEQLSDLPYLPGISNPSQVMKCIKKRFFTLKCFPASSIGGVEFLKQMNSVFSDVKFCPTGGINVSNASGYLKLPNVISVGGSFPLPKEAINNNDWKSITKIAKIFSQ